MRLCRVRFMIVLRPRAIRHKFRLGTGFTAAFLARQVPTSGRRKTAAKTDSRGWTPFRRPLRYRSQAMEKNAVTVIYGVQKRARYVYAPTSQMRRSAATDSGWYYDRVPIVINSGCTQDSRRYAFQASPTVSHTGDELIFTANCKRKTRLSWWAASFAVCHLRHWLRGLQNMAKGD